MFNKTDSLIFLSQYETIKEAFVRAVYAASEIDLSLEAEDRSHSTLAEVLKQRLETIDTFSPEDMAAAFRLVVPAQRRAADGLGPDEARAALLLPPRVNTVQVANRWLKYVFARLWSEKLVLLPAGFMMKHSFFPAEIRQILPGLPETALCQVSAEASDERSSGLGLRMTFSSNYYKFEDVDIDEFAALTLETIQRDDIRSAMWLGDPRRSRSSAGGGVCSLVRSGAKQRMPLHHGGSEGINLLAEKGGLGHGGVSRNGAHRLYPSCQPCSSRSQKFS